MSSGLFETAVAFAGFTKGEWDVEEYSNWVWPELAPLDKIVDTKMFKPIMDTSIKQIAGEINANREEAANKVAELIEEYTNALEGDDAQLASALVGFGLSKANQARMTTSPRNLLRLALAGQKAFEEAVLPLKGAAGLALYQRFCVDDILGWLKKALGYYRWYPLTADQGFSVLTAVGSISKRGGAAWMEYTGGEGVDPTYVVDLGRITGMFYTSENPYSGWVDIAEQKVTKQWPAPTSKGSLENNVYWIMTHVGFYEVVMSGTEVDLKEINVTLAQAWSEMRIARTSGSAGHVGKIRRKGGRAVDYKGNDLGEADYLLGGRNQFTLGKTAMRLVAPKVREALELETWDDDKGRHWSTAGMIKEHKKIEAGKKSRVVGGMPAASGINEAYVMSKITPLTKVTTTGADRYDMLKLWSQYWAMKSVQERDIVPADFKGFEMHHVVGALGSIILCVFDKLRTENRLTAGVLGDLAGSTVVSVLSLDTSILTMSKSLAKDEVVQSVMDSLREKGIPFVDMGQHMAVSSPFFLVSGSFWTSYGNGFIQLSYDSNGVAIAVALGYKITAPHASGDDAMLTGYRERGDAGTLYLVAMQASGCDMNAKKTFNGLGYLPGANGRGRQLRRETNGEYLRHVIGGAGVKKPPARVVSSYIETNPIGVPWVAVSAPERVRRMVDAYSEMMRRLVSPSTGKNLASEDSAAILQEWLDDIYSHYGVKRDLLKKIPVQLGGLGTGLEGAGNMQVRPPCPERRQVRKRFGAVEEVAKGLAERSADEAKELGLNPGVVDKLGDKLVEAKEMSVLDSAQMPTFDGGLNAAYIKEVREWAEKAEVKVIGRSKNGVNWAKRRAEERIADCGDVRSFVGRCEYIRDVAVASKAEAFGGVTKLLRVAAVFTQPMSFKSVREKIDYTLALGGSDAGEWRGLIARLPGTLFLLFLRGELSGVGMWVMQPGAGSNALTVMEAVVGSVGAEVIKTGGRSDYASIVVASAGIVSGLEEEVRRLFLPVWGT
jgi:hypothetical protein